MSLSNRERIGRGLELLRTALEPFVEQELKSALGGYWAEQTVAAFKEHSKPTLKQGKPVWDTASVLKAIEIFWREVFRKPLGKAEKSYVGELIDVRNRWAHDEAFSVDSCFRALDTMQRLTQSVAAGEQAAQLGRLKEDTPYQSYSKARAELKKVSLADGQPLAGLSPWRDVMTPHPDVASGRYLQAEFAADLAQVLRGQANPEYQDASEFFRRTYMTDSLKRLLQGAVLRLTGQGGDPVIKLQTNFGGGKTHSMLALYHLVGEKRAATLPGVDALCAELGIADMPQARRAVLVGTDLSPGQERRKADGTGVHTLWGELAWQLGGAEGYAMVASSDSCGTSPGSGELKALFDRYSPALILIDEWVAYARQLVDKRGLCSGDFEAQASFAQALTEAAKASPQVLLVASIPASNIELGGEHGEFALATLENVFQRVAVQWHQATKDEGYEIVRRRLFEPIAPEQCKARDAVVHAFSELYKKGKAEFPMGCGEISYRENLERAYPFHPALFEWLYERWSTLERFQRTRGVLRLLAKVVHTLWEAQDKQLMIMPGSVPLDDAWVRGEMTRYLDDHWEPVLTTDVDAPDALSLEIDRSLPTLGRYSAARRVARALFLGTAPGAMGRSPGIDEREVRLGTAQPGESTATFGDALRRLSDRATYLYVDDGRYWFSTQRTVNRLAEDRARQVSDADVKAAIEARLMEAARKRGMFSRVHAVPQGSSDVPDERDTRLVVLGPECATRSGQEDSAAVKRALAILQQRGRGPRVYRNSLVFLAPDVRRLEELTKAVREQLAWESIAQQAEVLNLTAFQQRQAETKRKNANSTVEGRLRETWIWGLLPSQEMPTSEVQWQFRRCQGPGELAERLGKVMANDQSLYEKLGAESLRHELDRFRMWPQDGHVALGTLKEWFAQYLYLPRLKDAGVLDGALQDSLIVGGMDSETAPPPFWVAERYDAAAERYRGLKRRSTDTIVARDELLVVNPAGGNDPRIRPSTQPPDQAHTPGAAADGGTGTSRRPPASILPTVFLASKKLSTLKMGGEASQIAEEIVQHLEHLAGTELEVKLEIRAKVPAGLSKEVRNVLKENCNALKFDFQDFQK